MGSLAERWANPFLLSDQAIRDGRFHEFVRWFWESKREREIYDIWLHRIWDKGFEDFRDSLNRPARPSESQVVATCKESLNILEGFNPKEV